MVTKMPGIEPFSTTQTFIRGFSISMIPVQIHFLFGSTIGGYASGALQPFFCQKQMKDGISSQRLLQQWSLM